MKQNCTDVFEDFELPFETYFQKGIDHPPQIHDETELIWIMRGTANIICDDIQYVMTSQTLFMVNAYQTHSIKSSEDTILISFRFTKEHLQKNNLSFDGMRFINRIYSIEELVLKYKEVPLLISHLLKLLISDKPDNLVRYKIIGYYNMFIFELYTMLMKERYLDIKKKDFTVYIARLNKVLEYINNHFLEKITLEEISEHVGISRYRLSHFVKEYIGVSFRDYLFNVRLEYAVRLLKNSDISITNVSRSSGFSDVKYLNKLMKTRFKTTALKYRKKVREHTQSNKLTVPALSDFVNELNICLTRFDSSQYD